MAHDQFQIPNYAEQSSPVDAFDSSRPSAERPPHAQPLLEALRIADTFYSTPETQSEAFRYLKEIEQRIESYRETAVAAEVKRSAFARYVPYVVGGVRRAPKVTLEKLINKEAVIGGTLFTKPTGVVDQRFWYQDQGGWFYEAVDAQKQSTVLCFQTSLTTVEKLVNGAPTPFTEGEAEVISRVPELYEKAVLQLYPIDAALQDDEEEIQPARAA